MSDSPIPPRAYFEGVFQALLEEIDKNPGFAVALAERLGARVVAPSDLAPSDLAPSNFASSNIAPSGISAQQNLAASPEEVDPAAAKTARRRAKAAPPPELLAMDITAARAELGAIGLRETLSVYTNAQLAALIRAKGLARGAISRQPKNGLLNILLRAARG